MPSVSSTGRGVPWKAAEGAVPLRSTKPAGPLRFRPFWLFFSAVLFLGLCSGIVWLVTWWTKPQAIQIVMLAAGYEANLAVPHNSYGRKWAGHAATLTGGTAHEFRRDVKWDAPLRRLRAKTLIFGLSAHGGTDASGPFLLPTDATLTSAPENRLRLSAILERMSGLPADMKKVVLLEAGQLLGNPLFGPAEADFAKALEATDFAAVPNLSVLTANGPGEMAYPAEIHGATAFGHFVRTGLAGDADADGDRRVTLWELFEYVGPRVEEWVAKNRAAVQKPRLFPAGDEGKRRAQAVVIAQVGGTASEPETSTSTTIEMGSVWQRYANRSRQQPSPASYAPHLWRLYGATLVRAEELALARDDAAATVLAKATELESQIDAARSVEVADPQLAAATFGPTPLDAESRAAVDRLWSATPADAVKAASQVPPSLAVYDVFLDRAADDLGRNLTRTAELVKLLDRPGRPRPLAAHLLVTLATKLPAPLITGRVELIRTALATRRLGEAAAAVGGQGYGERIAPWIATRLKAADAAQSSGEDRLFATDPGDAAERFAAAKVGYDSILADAALLRRAFLIRDRLFAELPGLADAANRIPADDAAATTAADELARLWAVAHDLDRSLVPPADAGDLARMADAAATRLNALATATLAPAKALLPAPPAGQSPRAGRDAIERALAMPTTDPTTREKLLPLLDRFVRETATATETSTKIGSPAVERRAALAAAAIGRGETRPPFQRISSLTDEVNRLLDADPVGDPAAVRKAYREADRLARIAPVALPPFRAEPAIVLRALHTQDIALGLAERQVDQLWAADVNADEPHYKVAAGRLLTDVSNLGSTDLVRDRVGKLRGRLDAAFRPSVVSRGSVTSIDPSPFAVEVDVKGERAEATAGFVTIWAEPQTGLNLVGGERRTALPWPGVAKYRADVTAAAAENRDTAVRVRAFFRGWDFAGTTPVFISPVPDVIASTDTPPAGATVALRASADAIRKYGCGDGSIAIVVDCSGSMAAVDGQAVESSKYAQAVAAAGKIIAALPRDTVVTVWAFGQAGEGKKRADSPERTIAKIAGPFRRDPDDATQETQITAKLAKLEPFNESPIYRATLSARDELLTATGYRAIVLISDGIDNRVLADPELNPRKELLPALLRTKFTEGNVLAHAVGFKTKGLEDTAAAENLRDLILDLPTPGKYVVAPDVDDLITALRAGLSSKLSAILKPTIVGNSIELDVTPGGTADRWAKAAAGAYQLRTTTRSEGVAVTLVNGDKLLVGLDAGTTGPTFRRLTLADEFPAKPFARSDRGDWRATLLQNQSRGGGVSLVVGLEATDTAVRIPRPADVWFDVGTDFPDLNPAAVRWRPLYDQTAATWEIQATGWPNYPGGSAPARPTVRVWFEPTASAASAATVALQQVLDAATPTSVTVGTETVTIERIDPASVAAPPGTLALRVRHAADRPILPRIDSVPTVSADRRIHARAGVTIGLFRLGDAADPKAAKVSLVSLAGIKAAARRIELRDLPQPDPDDRPLAK